MKVYKQTFINNNKLYSISFSHPNIIYKYIYNYFLLNALFLSIDARPPPPLSYFPPAYLLIARDLFNCFKCYSFVLFFRIDPESVKDLSWLLGLRYFRLLLLICSVTVHSPIFGRIVPLNCLLLRIKMNLLYDRRRPYIELFCLSNNSIWLSSVI